MPFRRDLRSRPRGRTRHRRGTRRLWRTLSGWPRFVLAGLCALLGIAGLFADHRMTPSGRSWTPVVTAVRPLAAGSLITTGDVAVRRYPASLVPTGARAAPGEVIGRRIGSAVGVGEAVTGTRLLNTALTDQLRADQVAVTVRLADGAQARLITAGSTVDLYTAGSGSGQTTALQSSGADQGPVAERVRVLAVLADPQITQADASITQSDTFGQPSLVVACSRQIATHIAFAASGIFLATLLPPS